MAQTPFYKGLCALCVEFLMADYRRIMLDRTLYIDRVGAFTFDRLACLRNGSM